MNKYNLRILVCSILCVLVISFMILSTFAYLNNKKEAPSNNELNDNISVTYKGSSNITLVNAKSEDTLTKTWNIKNLTNNTIYLNISLKNLVNNFNDNSIIYSLYSENKVDIKDANIINDNPVIASNIKLDSLEDISFELILHVLDNVQYNNTFSSSIDVNVISVGDNINKDTLIDKILKDNVLINDNNSTDSGLYWSNNSNDGIRIYYFKGNNTLNNNVKMGDMCFRIIRSTEDNGIKLIYNGNFTNGECNNSENTIGNSPYNTNYNYNAYVGYMYGSPNSNTYENEHKNTNSSTIKNFVNNFYGANLSDYSSLIQDSYYCNNRKVADFTYKSVKYSSVGYRNYNSGYESMSNLLLGNPSFKCLLENDRLNSKDTSYPIGMLTVDEALFAGLDNKNDNQDNYLYTNGSYWTMTPAYYDGINAYNFMIDNGKIIEKPVNNKAGVRPVITIKKDAIVISGVGSINDPYILD